MVKTNFYDLEFGSADFATSGGDLVMATTHTQHMNQLLVDALESRFNSMKYIFRNWGFEGRLDDYTTTDNLPKQKSYMFIAEILNVLSPFFRNILAVSPAFTATGFTMRIELQLSDIARTSYDKTLTWDQNTKLASVA